MNRNNLRVSDIAETAEIKEFLANIIFQTCTPRNLIGKYLWILNTIIHGVESQQEYSITYVDFTRGMTDYP